MRWPPTPVVCHAGMAAPITGFYDLTGEVVEVAELAGELIMRVTGVPDSPGPIELSLSRQGIEIEKTLSPGPFRCH